MEHAMFEYMNQKINLLQTLQLQLEDTENAHKRKQEQERHKLLVQQNDKKPCVYLLKIRETSPDVFDIKIGETEDITKRMQSHNITYGNPVLLDVFKCLNSHPFEQYILKRRDVKPQIVSGTREEIHITEEFTYEYLTKIIKKNVDKFNDISHSQRIQAQFVKLQEDMAQERLRIENLIATATNENDKEYWKNMYSANIARTEKIQSVAAGNNDEDEDEQDPIPISDRKVFKYSPDNLKTPIAQYYSLREAARSLNNPTFHDYHIRQSATNNTEFAGYRWFYIDGTDELPNEIPATAQEPPANAQPKRKKGLVAQLNKDRNKIVNVFANQKAATEALNITSGHLSQAITHDKMAGQSYWRLYDDCDENLKATFEGTLPSSARVATCSKVIQRIDPATDQVLETYHCLQDVCSLFRTCHKQLHKVSSDESVFKGFKWQIVSASA